MLNDLNFFRMTLKYEKFFQKKDQTKIKQIFNIKMNNNIFVNNANIKIPSEYPIKEETIFQNGRFTGFISNSNLNQITYLLIPGSIIEYNEHQLVILNDDTDHIEEHFKAHCSNLLHVKSFIGFFHNKTLKRLPI